MRRTHLAIFGSVLYVGDAFLVSGGALSTPLLLQLVVFVLVAVGTGYIAARLQEAGEGRERLQAELASVQLRAADILTNIRAGIITVDDLGRLLYANPSASEMLGMSMRPEGASSETGLSPGFVIVTELIARSAECCISNLNSRKEET